jgi:DNA-binding NarL/FixJ family response regulator
MKANPTPSSDIAVSDAPGASSLAPDPTPSRKSLRVLIADDHKLVRLGLRMVLERDGLDVVGEAATGRQAVDMAKELLPDVIVVDIVMPDMDGLQALAAIRASVPGASVVMTTAYNRPDFMARAIALGAGGYITKDDEPSSIPKAIRAVADGEAIVNREILQMALREIADTARSRPKADVLDVPSLTPQQLKVLSLIAEGMDNAAIATTLSVSRNTVKTHVREIFLKLGVTDRTQAAIRALRLGLA